LRQITKRNRAVSLEQMIDEANSFLARWATYFRHAHARSELRGLDAPAYAGVRCVRLKQCKQPQGLRRFLKQSGVPPRQACEPASSGRGWWCRANSLQAKRAMTIAWFDQLGLINLTARHNVLHTQGNRRGTWPVWPVV
jgi:RNA-directed DNA polymerase